MLSHMPLGDEINNFFWDLAPRNTSQQDATIPRPSFTFPLCIIISHPLFFFDGRESPHAGGGKANKTATQKQRLPNRRNRDLLGRPIVPFPAPLFGMRFFRDRSFYGEFFLHSPQKKGKWEFVITPKSPFSSLFFSFAQTTLEGWTHSPLSGEFVSSYSFFLVFFHCTVKKCKLLSKEIASCFRTD